VLRYPYRPPGGSAKESDKEMTPPDEDGFLEIDPQTLAELRRLASLPAHVWSCGGGEGVSYPDTGAAEPGPAAAGGAADAGGLVSA
jgi:hypothetical protein